MKMEEKLEKKITSSCKDLQERIEKWTTPEGIKFANITTKKLYQERTNRIINAIQLNKLPDRIPIIINVTFFPSFYAGVSTKESMYNYSKLHNAWKYFLLEFTPDSVPGPHIGSGSFFDILNCQNYAWPGHGIGEEHSFQFIEKEYMKEDEYDAFLNDTSDFIIRVYLPRIFQELEGLKYLPPLGVLINGHISNFVQFSKPEVSNAFRVLTKSGIEALKWAKKTNKFREEIIAAGFPQFGGAATLAPFDIIGNYLRGTKGIMLDIYRQPEKLLKALEITTSLSIKVALSNIRGDNPIIYIPLHKGGDDFLSDIHYKTFYWPFLKKVVLELIKNGFIIYLFAEGSYNKRLKFIKELPRGKTVWRFDQTDMKEAKEEIGDIACIAGNLPTSLLINGSIHDIKKYVNELIKVASRGGGFIMCNGAGIDNAKPENIKAMIDYTKEYGLYF